MSTSSIKCGFGTFHFVVVQWTSKKCSKKREARAEQLFYLQNQLFFDVVVIVVVALLSSLSYGDVVTPHRRVTSPTWGPTTSMYTGLIFDRLINLTGLFLHTGPFRLIYLFYSQRALKG